MNREQVKRLGSKFRWGIELEVIHNIDDDRILNKFSSIRDKVELDTDYLETTSSHPKSREIKIGINNLDDIDTIADVVSKVKKTITVNGSCGGHIHVSFADSHGWNASRLQKLYAQYLSYQNVIYSAFNVLSRRSERMCRKNNVISKSTISNMDRYDFEELHNDTKFWGMNFQSLNEKGTVEYRFPNGTFNGTKIKARVMFLAAFTITAVISDLNMNVKEWNTKDFRSLYNKIKAVGNILFGRSFGWAWLNGVVRNPSNSSIQEMWEKGQRYYKDK